MALQPLLVTKLHIPGGRPELIERRQLLARLDHGLTGRLSLVCAPAGFGKTTLAAAWVNSLDRPAAWLMLDEGDNDPLLFLRYLVAAVQSACPGVGQATQRMLQNPPNPAAGQELLTVWLNELAVAPPLVLVLDDYHVIHNLEVHRALGFLCAHLPQSMHLVLISRTDPPLPLTRLRARGQLTELRAADLRFSEEEAGQFLTHAFHLALDARQIAGLTGRTEGWVAGLQLAALALRDRPDATPFIEALAHGDQYILDYLFDEIFSQQPPAVQRFLLATAVVERMCGPLCDALSGEDGGQAQLEALHRANLFILPLDSQRSWYRYHRLFGDLLLHRLRRTDPDWPPVLHRRAAAWFEAQGDCDRAIHHLLSGGDFAAAADLIQAQALDRLENGQIRLLLDWAARLPAELLAGRPLLRLNLAWALLFSGQTAQLTNILAGVEAQTGDAALLGQCDAIRSYLALIDARVEDARYLSGRALERLPAGALSLRSIVAFTQGGAAILGDRVEESARAMQQAAAWGQAAGNLHLAVSALRAFGQLRAAQGHLGEAQRVYQSAIQLASPDGQPLPFVAGVYAGLARLYYEWNRLAECADCVQKGLTLGHLWGNPDSLVSVLLAQVSLCWAQGDAPGAERALAEAAGIVRQQTLTPGSDNHLAALQLTVSITAGDLPAAHRILRARSLPAHTPPGLLNESELAARARYLTACGDLPAAIQELERLYQAAGQQGRAGNQVALAAQLAVVLARDRQTARALDLLETTLAQARIENYVRSFLDEGEGLYALLASVRPAHLHTYANTLLAAAGRPAPSPVVPLTGRELELLQLIADGLSNAEIARRLVISTGTVKAHTASIYRKLDASNRAQAVLLAAQYGLIRRG